MEKRSARRELFAVVIAVAVALICIGVYNVWRSFERFDNSILAEKDTQLYSLMRSDDINIENSLNSLVREAETFFAREKLKHETKEWTSEGDSSGVKEMLAANPLMSNPIYADVAVIRKGKIAMSASGRKDYSFITSKDSNGIRLCMDGDGKYYMAYEHDYSKNIQYEALIDLKALYSTSINTNPEREAMLLDFTSTVLLSSDGGEVIVSPVSADDSERTEVCRDYLISCQNKNISDGMSLELPDANGEKYTARMVAMPSGSTVNGEFAMGIIVNYEEAIGPSRTAAEEILIYGGIAIVGVIGLLLMLVLLRRANDASSEELRALKKKNEVMEEINQKMQALTHHQRLETIGTMTASIAHDFNNLLTPIMGYSIMTMEMLPADATDLQENLMEVYNASVKAKDIVTRLAELTKKGNELNYRDVGIDEAIRSALKVTLPAKPKEVEVKASFDAENVMVRADRTQISQMVMNIVLNAYDAMRGEGGTLRVSTRQSGEEVLIRFRDTGCGMDAETVSRIFDPFYTTKESGKGTGLGLAIVAQIIETHGGRIYVESEPGKGTEFRIYLPCAGSSLEGLGWGSDGSGKYDTKRYDANLFRRALAQAEAEKRQLEDNSK